MADKNPYATMERNFQNKFSVNLWASMTLKLTSIVRHHLIGTYFLAPRLNKFFKKSVACSAGKCTALREKFNGYIVDFPDLIPMDFFFWGRFISLMYQMPVNSAQGLKAQNIANDDAIA